MPLPERPAITDLLDTHRQLLQAHGARLKALMAIAIQQGVAPSEMAFIVADVGGQFGQHCIEQGAGTEFLVSTHDAPGVMVIPAGADGLVVILDAIIPEGVPPVITRPAGTCPILIVDHQDEPAVVLKDIKELVPVPAS